MKRHLSLISLVMFLSLVLTACGTPSTPAPTATPTSTPGIEVKVGETVIRITEVNFGKYKGTRVTNNKDDLGTLGGYEAEPGFHYAELIADVTQGESAEEVSEWAVMLQDSTGKSYDAAVKGWGVFLGGANKAGWTFHIPENASQLKLILPDGLSIDLSQLIAK